MHRLVPFDPAADGQVQLQSLLDQGAADREHMAVLKAAIEQLHEVQQTHAVEISHNSRRGDEQVLINRRLAGDMASITGTCRGVAESHREDLRKTREKIDILETGLPALLEAKLMNGAEEITKLQAVATNQHQASEGMGIYLGSIVGGRPAEGKVIKGAFEHFHTEINVLETPLSASAHTARRAAAQYQ